MTLRLVFTLLLLQVLFAQSQARWPRGHDGHATLPLHLGLQIILTGHSSLIKNVDSVGYVSSRQLPEGYIEFTEDKAAYKIYEIYLTWIGAQEHCRSDGGHLAIATSRDIIQRINSTKPDSGRWVHGGIHRSSTGTDWLRVDNGHVTSVPWADVNASHTKDCTIIMMREGGISDVNCNQDAHFVCSIPIAKVYEVATPEAVTLPDGYVSFNRFQIAYKIHTELLNWNEARKECIKNGGNLAVIDSRDKIAAIMGMERPKAELYIGIHNKFNTAEWLRADNNLPVTFVPWAPRYPNGGGRCIFLWQDGKGVTDHDCEVTRPFVCEISIPT